MRLVNREDMGPVRLWIDNAMQWLWGLLPDNCEMPNCCRKGVRGNENIVDGKVMCDYCHGLDMLRRGHPTDG